MQPSQFFFVKNTAKVLVCQVSCTQRNAHAMQWVIHVQLIILLELLDLRHRKHLAHTDMVFDLLFIVDFENRRTLIGQIRQNMVLGTVKDLDEHAAQGPHVRSHRIMLGVTHNYLRSSVVLSADVYRHASHFCRSQKFGPAEQYSLLQIIPTQYWHADFIVIVRRFIINLRISYHMSVESLS